MTKGLLLVVDDEAVARITLQKILQLQGYDVVAVASGELALQELVARNYHLLILDLKMPGMNGLEVLRQCSGVYPGLGVIIITAFGTMDSAIQAMRFRAIDYLLKPIPPPEIIRAVEKAMLVKEKEEPLIAEGESKREPAGIVSLNKKLTVDFTKRVINYNGNEIFLTATESKLLQILWDNRNRVIASSDIVWQVQNYRVDSEEAGRVLRPVMCRLRKKLDKVPELKSWVRNIRGSGYVFDYHSQKEKN